LFFGPKRRIDWFCFAAAAARFCLVRAIGGGEYANNGISSANAHAGCGWACVAGAAPLTDPDDYA